MSKNEIMIGKEKDSNSLLTLIEQQLKDDDIEEVSYKISKKKKIVNITGKKANELFTITRCLFDGDGIVQNLSKFNTNISKSNKEKHIKSLSDKGYKQKEIASMLGISQAQVSNILHK